jgi:hypothetical protein
VTRLRARRRRFDSRKEWERDFVYLLHSVQTVSGSHTAPYPVGTRGSFPGDKATRYEADHSPPFSAEVKNSWGYNSKPPASSWRFNCLRTSKVKVTLSLCFNWAPCYEGVLGRGVISPHFLDLDTRWRLVVSFTTRPLYPQGNSPWYPLYRKLIAPQIRAGRGGEKKNSLSLPRLELQISSS